MVSTMGRPQTGRMNGRRISLGEKGGRKRTDQARQAGTGSGAAKQTCNCFGAGERRNHGRRGGAGRTGSCCMSGQHIKPQFSKHAAAC
jgi:hypothetical protein